MKLTRSCIYSKDIQRITGKSERSARRLIQQIKDRLGKEEHHYITIDEFADFTGISLDIVHEYIND